MQQKFILAGSIVFALLAFFFTQKYISNLKAELYKGARQIRVLAVAQDFTSGTSMQSGDLGVLTVFETSVGQDVFEASDANLNKILGKKLTRSMKKGEILRWADVDIPYFSRSRFADTIGKEENLRAISIPVSAESSVAGLIRPNDHVDIIGTFTKSGDDPRLEGETITRLLLQDVTILATGQEYATADAQERAQWRRSGSFSTVTLEVTPREAELLVFMMEAKGTLSLMLRKPGNLHYEPELPRVNFTHLEQELSNLNGIRQAQIRKRYRP